MPKEDWATNNLAVLFNLEPVESVLDVACGLSLKSKYIEAKIRVGVDIYPKYFQNIEAEVPYVVVKHDVRDLLSVFLPNSFDLVIACDIIEHLTKEEGFELIRQCEQIARKAVIFETPFGFIPQNLDILGFGGDEFQTHRSGWSTADFRNRGYQTFLRDYQMSDAKRHTDLNVPSAIQLIEAIKYV